MRRLLLRTPAWLLVLLGAACAVLGAVIVLRPYTSLTVLRVLVTVALAVSGVTDLLAARRTAAPGWTAAAGGLWLLSAVLVAVYPGLALDTLAVVVGVALVAGGLARLVGALRGRGDDRAARTIGAIASVVFGALALAWPDVTLLVVAVVFGARTFLFGCLQIATALHRRPPDTEGGPRDDGRPRRLRGWPRTLAASVSLLVALALLAVSAALHRGGPQPEAFYRPPAAVPATPGALLRAETYTRAVPDGARAWRILYTTTRDDGVPAVASAIVLTARHLPPGPRPVIAWAHGTTGIDESCAPSLLKNPFEAGALPALDRIVGRGWVLVATDYTGLGTAGPHPYLVGQGEARSVLDAVRAARHLDHPVLSDRTVVWGHSQGGHAALWTGGIQPGYAPDVPLAGVAALAPASDLTGLVSNLATVPGGAVFAAYVAAAYAQTYPDVSLDALIRPEARAQVRGYAGRCLAEPEVFVSIASSLLADKPIFRSDPAAGAVGQRLKQNTPSGRIAAPLLIAQGETDPLVLPTVQQSFVRAACAAGDTVDYRTYPGRDHVGVVAPDSALVPDLLQWTQDRIDGAPAQDTCR